MGGVISAISSIAPILTAIGSVTSIVSALTTKASTAKIKLPTYKIPEEEMQALKQQIAQNINLSDEARKTAIEALERYRQGQLTPALEDLYNKWLYEQEQTLKAELARRGFTEGSTAYREAMNRLLQQAGAYRAQLLEMQLHNALKTAGLSDVAINNLLSKWKVESGLTAQEANRLLAEQQARMAQRQYDLERWARIGGALGQLGNVFSSMPSISKSAPSMPELEPPTKSQFFSLSPPEYTDIALEDYLNKFKLD